MAESLCRGRLAALDAGLTPVLFTDLANPTSNKIYQRLSYRPVTDAAEYAFRVTTRSRPRPGGDGGGSARQVRTS